MIKLTICYKQQLGVVVKDVCGNVVDNYSAINWTFSNDLATIDSDGVLTAGDVAGFGDVTATLENSGISGSESVEIVSGPASVVEVVKIGDVTK